MIDIAKAEKIYAKEGFDAFYDYIEANAESKHIADMIDLAMWNAVEDWYNTNKCDGIFDSEDDVCVAYMINTYEDIVDGKLC